MTDHEDFEGLAAGYALHALEPQDEQRLAVHLLTCHSCARLVADTAAIGAAFAEFLVPEATEPAPAGLRARILAAAAAEPRMMAPTFDKPVPRPMPTPTSPAPRSRGARGGADRRSRIRRVDLRSLVAVGALAAVVGIGVAVPVTLGVSGAGKSNMTNSALAQWLTAPGAREVTLTGSSKASVAKAVMTSQGVYLVASGLAVNDRTRSVYVLWAANADGVRSAVATFDVRSGSPVQFTASKLPFKMSDISQVAVSYEPGRQAPAKPSDVVLSGTAA